MQNQWSNDSHFLAKGFTHTIFLFITKKFSEKTRLEGFSLFLAFKTLAYAVCLLEFLSYILECLKLERSS